MNECVPRKHLDRNGSGATRRLVHRRNSVPRAQHAARRHFHRASRPHIAVIHRPMSLSQRPAAPPTALQVDGPARTFESRHSRTRIRRELSKRERQRKRFQSQSRRLHQRSRALAVASPASAPPPAAPALARALASHAARFRARARLSRCAPLRFPVSACTPFRLLFTSPSPSLPFHYSKFS